MSEAAVAELLKLLELEKLDLDLFRGGQPMTERERVYGGQAAAQAIVAASYTVEEGFFAHSMHSYFLRPGDYGVPIIYDVDRIRDGRSFKTRRVIARQHGHPIYSQIVNFHLEEEGLEHQDVMPPVRPPEEGFDMMELMKERGNPEAEELTREWAALEARWMGNSNYGGVTEDPERPSRAQAWVRIAGKLPDDPLIQLAAFTYASDVSLLSAALAAHRTNPAKTQMASLDHSLWFHRPFRADQWWLYDQWSPWAGGARGLAIGRVFTADGTLVATAAQEGLIRQRR